MGAQYRNVLWPALRDLIHAILDYGGEGIRFICMRCRLKPPSTGDDSEDAGSPEPVPLDRNDAADVPAVPRNVPNDFRSI